MAEIFISWGRPDQARVQVVCEQIRAAGFEVFEYTDDMRAGDNITKRVLTEINQARIAIICLSDEVVDRPWVALELAWAYQALDAGDRPMRAVAPLRVGELADGKRPAEIAHFGLYVADLLGPSDADWGIDKLIRDLCAQLNRQPPLVIPATVIAMDATRCDDLPRMSVPARRISTRARLWV
jgi:TIR domain